MGKLDDLQWDSSGLMPAVVQDADTGEVLTLAYVNRKSLEKTCQLGETVFFSRSRQALWHKGETSGNYQKVVSLAADCDKDALVIRVRPKGPACHTGARSCFFRELEGFSRPSDSNIGSVLAELEQLIAARKTQRPQGSYTTSLFDRGIKRILQKVGEEAVETVVAGMSGDRQETTMDGADLLYHLLVAFSEMNISLDDLAAELQARRK